MMDDLVVCCETPMERHDDRYVCIQCGTQTTSRERTEKRGGRRNEIAVRNGKQVGRPRKDNVTLHCHVPPFILQEIDKHRGALSRGEYITMLMDGAAIDRSNQT